MAQLEFHLRDQAVHRLTLIAAHLKDDQVTELSFDDLAAYGFATLDAD